MVFFPQNGSEKGQIKKENRRETEKEGNNEARGKSVLQLSAAALNIIVMGLDRGCTFLNSLLRIQPKPVGVTKQNAKIDETVFV